MFQKSVSLAVCVVFIITSTCAEATAKALGDGYLEQAAYERILAMDDAPVVGSDEGAEAFGPENVTNGGEDGSDIREGKGASTPDIAPDEGDAPFYEAAEFEAVFGDGRESAYSRYIIKYREEEDGASPDGEETAADALRGGTEPPYRAFANAKTSDGVKSRVKPRFRNRDIAEFQSVLEAKLRKSAKANGLRIKSLTESQGVALVEAGKNVTVAELIEGMSGEDALDIEYIQPDYEMQVSAMDIDVGPSEVSPELGNLWGHHNVISDAQGRAVNMDAGVLGAWEATKGAGVIVAVLDTGFDTSHPDLAGRLLPGWDFVNDDAAVDDDEWKYDQWHGTHVAGTIAAALDGAGTAGVAPEAMALPLKVFQGGAAYTSDIIEAIEYAESHGASVANMSFGSRSDNPALREAMERSAMLFVCAAGNGGYDIGKYPVYPAAFGLPNVLSVASLGRDGKLSRFSNWGAETVDLAAPGAEIYGAWTDGGHNFQNGASMAAAYAAGAAALLKSARPSLTARELKDGLLGMADIVTGLKGKVRDGNKLSVTLEGLRRGAPGFSLGAVHGLGEGERDEPEAPLAGMPDRVLDRKSLGLKNVIDIPDGPMEDINPEWDPNDEAGDGYELSGAENMMTVRRGMTTPRGNLAAVALNGKIYALGGGGSRGARSKTAEAYDPKTDRWETAPAMKKERGAFAAFAFGGKIYAIGGDDVGTVETFDPATGNWSLLPGAMPYNPGGFAAALDPDNGKAYILGGANENRVAEYDLGANTWRVMPTGLPTKLYGHSAVFFDGRIYTEGGRTNSTNDNFVRLYDMQIVYDPAKGSNYGRAVPRPLQYHSAVAKGSHQVSFGGSIPKKIIRMWDETFYRALQYTSNIRHSELNAAGGVGSYSHMSLARAHMGAAEMDGKVYLIGGVYGLEQEIYSDGRTFTTGENVTGLVEEFDLGYGGKVSLPVPLADFETVGLGGRLYVVGGRQLVNGAETRSDKLFQYIPESGGLTRKADVPETLYNISAAAGYGKLYLSGTATASAAEPKKLYEYDPVADAWTLKATVSAGAGAAVLAFWSGKIYIVTTISASRRSVRTYDPVTGTVAGLADITTPLPGTGKLSAVALGSDLYLLYPDSELFIKGEGGAFAAGAAPRTFTGNVAALGSRIFSFPSGISERYGDVGEYSAATGNASQFRTYFDFRRIVMTASMAGKTYLFGNEDGGSFATALLPYSPPSSVWKEAFALSEPKAAIGCTVYNGEIYVAGGFKTYSNDVEATPVKTFEKYDPDTGAVTKLADMNEARGNLSLVAVGGKFYAIGGKTSKRAHTYTVEEYDPATGAWVRKASAGEVASNLATVVWKGKIYTFGGNTGAAGQAKTTVLCYDPAQNKWEKLDPMPGKKSGASAALFGDKVYVAGGYTLADYEMMRAPTNSLYVYDLETRQWDLTKSPMPNAFGLAATAARENMYMVGGGSVNMEFLPDVPYVHEYSPALDKWFVWDGPNAYRYMAGAAIIGDRLYVLGGMDNSAVIGTVEYADLRESSTDYRHLGEEDVNLTGNLARNYTDMEWKAPGFNVVVGRTYNSQDDRDAAKG
ncbi:MAG: S8 family serine peptidase, partial [Clostridiales Family XIII bacterium]|nr:S8 family serine peptidase [Clostridiales Family XIII bacterium]